MGSPSLINKGGMSELNGGWGWEFLIDTLSPLVPGLARMMLELTIYRSLITFEADGGGLVIGGP